MTNGIGVHTKLSDVQVSRANKISGGRTSRSEELNAAGERGSEQCERMSDIVQFGVFTQFPFRLFELLSGLSHLQFNAR